MPQEIPQPEPAVAPTPAPAPADAPRAVNSARIADALRQAMSDDPGVAPPRTAQEVIGLHSRLDMLRQQLGRAEERRGEIARELRGLGEREEGRPVDRATEAAERAGLEARLGDADARVMQIERDIAATDRALTQAAPNVLAQYEVERPREIVQQGMDEGEAFALSAFSFLGGIVLLTVGRRIRAWRRRRGGAGLTPAGAPAGVGPDPRIDRLTQAVDAIAVEVERIGEGQRFVTQLMAERRGLAAADPERTLDPTGVR